MPDLLPLFLNLAGRAVLLVGGGRVATAKLQQLLAAGARVRVVAPEISLEILGTSPHVQFAQRPFEPADVDGVWLVVAAATPSVNREVAAVAETQRVFVNAVDDPANASASSPPRPNTNGSPPFNRTTRRPRRAARIISA